MVAKKIALFIDADNISAKFGKQIIDALERRGEIFIRRIYGNWEKFSLHGWNECILNFSLRAIQQPDYVAGKNATDMSLVIDAMDVLYGGKAEIFALASNDSDFTPLAVRLREAGIKIIGMGTAQAANSFRVACDEFIDLDAPAEIKSEETPALNSAKKISPAPVQMSLFDTENISAAPVAVNPKIISISDSRLQSDRDKKIQTIHDVLREAAKTYGDNAGFALLNCAGADLKEKNLGFTVRDFGYNQLKDFLFAYPKLYELKNAGTKIFYRCKNGDDKFKQIHDVLREAAKTYGDNAGFVNLGQAGNFIIQKNLSLKDSGHSKLSKFISAFQNLYELKENSYRCR
ncbi:MAG: NYN domain-containing protein [Quinella sp. 3Q1]|nr:NYN domain-containing protein [Quinella sp. 3Q1]